jgi:hypothetical protein
MEMTRLAYMPHSVGFPGRENMGLDHLKWVASVSWQSKGSGIPNKQACKHASMHRNDDWHDICAVQRALNVVRAGKLLVEGNCATCDFAFECGFPGRTKRVVKFIIMVIIGIHKPSTGEIRRVW